MKVTLEWSEEVSYESTIEIPDEEILAWANEDLDKDDPAYVTEIDAALVKMFISESDFEWFEECDTTTDFSSVDERDLNSVSLAS